MKAPLRYVATDWFQLIWDLAQHEWSPPKVAQHTGIGLATLYDYRDGGHPIHWRGELLIELWCSVCGKARQDAPQTEVILAPRVVHPAPQVRPTDDTLDDLAAVSRGWGRAKA